MTKMCEMAKINTTHTRPHHTDAFSGSYKQTWLCRTFTLSAHMHCNQMDFERFPNWRLCAHQSNISQHFRLHFSLFFNRMYTHKHRHRQSKKTPEEYIIHETENCQWLPRMREKNHRARERAKRSENCFHFHKVCGEIAFVSFHCRQVLRKRFSKMNILDNPCTHTPKDISNIASVIYTQREQETPRDEKQ